MEKRNKVYLDFIRIIAIFLVVINHTGAFRFPDCPGWFDIAYWCQMIWNDIVKMAVPMFFMVSGALLLPKEETIAELFKKRILRFALVYILIIVVQYLYCVTLGDGKAGLPTALYFGSSMNAFYASWFLCAYIGILLMLPIIRIIARHMLPEHYVYVLSIQFITCCFLPMLIFFAGREPAYCFVNQWMPFHSKSATLEFSYGYCVFYLLLGYFAEYHTSFIRKIGLKRLAFAAVTMLLAEALCLVVIFNSRTTPGIGQPVVVFSAFLPIPCIAAYSLAKRFFETRTVGERTRNLIAKCGAATFVVMLTENLFRVNISPFLVGTLCPVIGAWASYLVLAVVVTLCALILGLILKQVPGIRKLV